MTTAEIVTEIQRRGVSLRVVGERLMARGPADVLATLRRAIAADPRFREQAIALVGASHDVVSAAAEAPCAAYSAPHGSATCSTCGAGYGAHYWASGDACAGFVPGAADGRCRRCGDREYEHARGTA